MNQFSFIVQRVPCIPKPHARKAIEAKSKILSRGGCFYRFSIDGCTGTSELVEYLLEQYGLSERTILDAIDSMANVSDPEMGIRTKDVWGVSEIEDGNETVTFTGFAMTEEELENKTKLFLSSVQKLKECLEVAFSSSGRGMVGTSSWNI
ncbi:MAG: hypothetical protein AB9919_12620 [Geobacteraceae bacterium]|jgi:hypothetical protein